MLTSDWLTLVRMIESLGLTVESIDTTTGRMVVRVPEVER